MNSFVWSACHENKTTSRTVTHAKWQITWGQISKLGQKKKLLYWRNPTDPKIRPDPTFFFKNQKKKKDKKMTDRS